MDSLFAAPVRKPAKPSKITKHVTWPEGVLEDVQDALWCVARQGVPNSAEPDAAQDSYRGLRFVQPPPEEQPVAYTPPAAGVGRLMREPSEESFFGSPTKADAAAARDAAAAAEAQAKKDADQYASMKAGTNRRSAPADGPGSAWRPQIRLCEACGMGARECEFTGTCACAVGAAAAAASVAPALEAAPEPEAAPARSARSVAASALAAEAQAEKAEEVAEFKVHEDPSRCV